MTTFHAHQTKEEIAHLLGEVYAEIPRELTELSPRDVNRLAAIHDELKSEGRTMRPFRHNFKE